MSADSQGELIAALRRAIELDASPELRVHLASLLTAADPADALRLATDVLGEIPDHLQAIEIAATCCERLGRESQAAAYRRLASSLQPATAPEPVPAADAVAPSDLGELAELWDATAAPPEPEIGHWSKPDVKLHDVGGMVEVKQHLEMAFFGPLRHPELALAFNKRVHGGLLLWGPPGCGKTFIARAVAGELGASFYSIGIADVLDMWVGSSERNLHGIFTYARQHRPCVLFFDELDALGRKRSGLRQGGAALRGVVNQLLAELDGFSADNDGVFVLAATNHPWDLDEALIRPGRFDRSLLVLPPDPDARQQILRHHLVGRPAEEIKWKPIISATDGWSGADLAHLCESVTERALAESVGAAAIVRVSDRHFKEALRQIRPSIDAWFETARNYAMYANGDGRFDGLIEYLGRRR